MRKPLIAANWKMYRAPAGAWDDGSPYLPHVEVDVIVLPSALDLERAVGVGCVTGGQYGHPEAKGAHTGDISIQMLKDLGCTYHLCGHSERRRDHHETDAMVGAQVKAALELGLLPIACIGETLEERDSGKAKEVVKRQLSAFLPLLEEPNSESRIPNLEVRISNLELVIAYEPVWAIGTGKSATPELAQEMHAFIRSVLPAHRQASTRILYGGSAKPETARGLMQQQDIDGLLVGAASIIPHDFAAITASALPL